MMKRIWACILSAALVLSVSACGNKTGTSDTKTTAQATAGSENGTASSSDITANEDPESSSVQTEAVDYASVSADDVEAIVAQDAEDSRKAITGEFTVTTETENGYTVSGSTVTITTEGEYTLSGVLEGNLVVDAVEAKVEIRLSGCSITCSDAAPITVRNAKNVSISAEKETFNEVIDARDVRSEDPEEETTPANAGAAIYSTCDLTVKGHGALVVSAAYNNGIASKDDLEVKNLTLRVTAANDALKGNDSVTLEDAEIIAIAKSGDGIQTDNSGLSDKGNQKGTITISGGTVNIYAGRDGIASAYDVVLTGNGSLSIDTDTYSDYTEEGASTGGTDIYLILSTSAYDSGSDYYACYSKGTDTENGVFVKTSETINVFSGRTSYYGLLLKAPAGYDHVTFCSYEKGAEADTDNYEYCSETMTINTSQNAYLISSLSESLMSGDWVTLSRDSSGKNGQEYSTKGIKAENVITIDGEITVVIRSTDDAIHVNGGDELENGATGAGEFVMNGGRIKLTTADDGVHADGTLTVNSGLLIITGSYEGLEAAEITINGGRSYVYASDDAVNGAASGYASATVTVNGGYLEVETPSGDTDAIDVNGSYIQTGGFVLVKGGSTMGSVAGSVDVDGSVTVDGGCIIACGGVCEGPEGKANAYIESGTSLAAGDYTLTDGSGNIVCAFTLDGSYYGFWVACDGLATGGEYALTTGGKAVLSWTQEEGTMGTGNSFGSGFGGGFGGGRRP